MNCTIRFPVFVFLLLLVLLFLLSGQFSRFSAPRSILESAKETDWAAVEKAASINQHAVTKWDVQSDLSQGGFCDFAGSGDESVFALCEGNKVTIEPDWCWRNRDTMHSVGKFLSIFRKLGLQGYQLAGDQGFGHQLMDRMQEQGFVLRRFNNGSPAKCDDIFFNLSAEWWSTVGQLIERRQIIIPNDEKLIAQLTSRRKLYDSRGRERLESKADLKSRGVESPDRADALIGAIMMRLQSDPYAFDPAGHQAMSAMMDATLRRMERSRPIGYVEHVNWNSVW